MSLIFYMEREKWLRISQCPAFQEAVLCDAGNSSLFCAELALSCDTQRNEKALRMLVCSSENTKPPNTERQRAFCAACMCHAGAAGRLHLPNDSRARHNCTCQ